jgi:uncharacterized protein (DUF488 family)
MLRWPLPCFALRMPNPFHTVGHSTLTFEAFAALLALGGVTHVADVRRFPASRRHPHFNSEPLAASLADIGIGYRHVPALGGRRSAQRDSTTNAYWEHPAFRAYADYAATRAFGDAFDALRELGRTERVAVMCAEAVWWRCHRRIIADYLLAHGETVVHLMPPATVEAATLTPAAARRADGTLRYDKPGDLFTETPEGVPGDA